ncbi:hypothetical protein HHL23_22070 [Chryseobacterium sp. RP-3-3]|uniref:HTH luxR-type domain-containing protein n=1 Tax=Chryseobacterium antibioticum TaxID=2728847 RepID=A0A7Y0AS16_9FLAO|nr:LuxR C-terminal-related transcriptional regulator [Chryseobacterium antibioticum]NML72446.1 hypothetical protein [Chryseobacterium antibioticum]
MCLLLRLKYKRLFLGLLIVLVFLNGCNKKNNITDINLALNKSDRLRLEGKKKEVISLNNEIIKLSKEENYKKGEALAYINLSNIYGTIGNYKLSQHFLKLAEKIAFGINDNFVYTRLYHEYGQMNYVIGLTSTALKYNSKAIYYGNKLDEKGWLLGNIYEQRADFLLNTNKDSALHYYHMGFDVDPSALNSALIGNYHLRQTNNLDSASFYINNALILLKKKDNLTIRPGTIYFYYAELCFKQKDYTKALEFYEKSLVILKKTRRINKLPEVYQKTALAYKKLNQFEKENEYLTKYNQLSDSLKRSGNEAIDISVSEAIEKNDYSISKYTTLYLIIFLSILGVLVILFFKYTKKQKNKDSSIPILEEKKPEHRSTIPNEYFAELLSLAKNNDIKFLNRFEETHPTFFQNLFKHNSELTRSELSLCGMILLGLSSKDIADFSFIQHRSVQIKKGRLRKKLNISSDVNLYNFFKTLN